MEKRLYYIDCITNLHVGSGDVNFNIVDQEVEKDPILRYPIIHSSGIKGALRANAVSAGVDADIINKVFGAPCNTNAPDGAGTYRFFNADILYRPLRATGKFPCVKVTTVKIIQNFIDVLNNFGKKLPEGLSGLNAEKTINAFADGIPFLVSNASFTSIEGEKVKVMDDATKNALKSLLGEDFAIVKEFDGFDLPVIARNNLQISSGGLWYEEYVPRGSRFFMLVLTPDNENIEAVIPEMVQIGGNASIGYGYCKFTNVK